MSSLCLISLQFCLLPGQGCRYKVGRWSDCHQKFLIRQRQDELLDVQGQGTADCAQQNVIEKTCNADGKLFNKIIFSSWHRVIKSVYLKQRK